MIIFVWIYSSNLYFLFLQNLSELSLELSAFIHYDAVKWLIIFV